MEEYEFENKENQTYDDFFGNFSFFPFRCKNGNLRYEKHFIFDRWTTVDIDFHGKNVAASLSKKRTLTTEIIIIYVIYVIYMLYIYICLLYYQVTLKKRMLESRKKSTRLKTKSIKIQLQGTFSNILTSNELSKG